MRWWGGRLFCRRRAILFPDEVLQAMERPLVVPVRVRKSQRPYINEFSSYLERLETQGKLRAEVNAMFSPPRRRPVVGARRKRHGLAR